jgi:NAD(P)-dependent dehydrogenase (short-subunit alcohol dehydrogenase family)
MKTVFITGASSGIGKATAKYFAQNGWNVAATMRRPELETELTGMAHVLVTRCDVTKPETIHKAISETIDAFGGFDVLVNNAGYDSAGALEAAEDEQIRRQLDTNLLGTILATKAALPHFRARKNGMIINISSIAGRLTFPLHTLYHTTKWGMEGFSESLQYELCPLGIRVKLIEPGAIRTDFYSRSMTVMEDETLTEYRSMTQTVLDSLVRAAKIGSSPELVAKSIYRAANTKSWKLRYTVGKGGAAAILRPLIPMGLYRRAVGMLVK